MTFTPPRTPLKPICSALVLIALGGCSSSPKSGPVSHAPPNAKTSSSLSLCSPAFCKQLDDELSLRNGSTQGACRKFENSLQSFCRSPELSTEKMKELDSDFTPLSCIRKFKSITPGRMTKKSHAEAYPTFHTVFIRQGGVLLPLQAFESSKSVRIGSTEPTSLNSVSMLSFASFFSVPGEITHTSLSLIPKVESISVQLEGTSKPDLEKASARLKGLGINKINLHLVKVTPPETRLQWQGAKNFVPLTRGKTPRSFLDSSVYDRLMFNISLHALLEDDSRFLHLGIDSSAKTRLLRIDPFTEPTSQPQLLISLGSEYSNLKKHLTQSDTLECRALDANLPEPHPIPMKNSL